jgi:hypothetical protein
MSAILSEMISAARSPGRPCIIGYYFSLLLSICGGLGQPQEHFLTPVAISLSDAPASSRSSESWTTIVRMPWKIYLVLIYFNLQKFKSLFSETVMFFWRSYGKR